MTEPITMYSIRYTSVNIEPKQVGRLTAKTACVINRDGTFHREHLRTESGGLYPTWEEAHAALLANAEQELSTARLYLQRVQGKVGNIKGMKKP